MVERVGGVGGVGGVVIMVRKLENGMLSDVNELVAVEHLQYAFGVCCFVFLYG